MRDNTRQLRADPRFSVQDYGPKGQWGLMRFSSPRDMLAASVAYARTPNERWGTGEDSDGYYRRWKGLGEQDWRSLDSSGIAEHPLKLTREARARLPAPKARPGSVRPTVCGGYWSTPDVLSGRPLAARARVRDRLAPLTIRLVCSWSASVDSETLAPVFAKLGRALNDYTLAGGAVTLTIFLIGEARRTTNGTRGLICECRVPANDLAQLSLGGSVTALRHLAGPLMTAYSEAASDSIPVPTEQENPIPNSLYLGGRTSTGDIAAQIEKVIKSLNLH